jgi:pimeloyl-ACP methyl ester carboxylesterase
MLPLRRPDPAMIPTTPIGDERYVATGAQRIRVNIRHGTGVPLVLCNGIDASLEVLDPLVERLDPDSTVIRFDVPGTGGSPTSVAPYGFPYLAWVLGRVLSKLGVRVVDVLGISWGGALAQQFAFQNPRRCRRLVLVATGTGALMVPAHPRILAKMLTPRRCSTTGGVGLEQPFRAAGGSAVHIDRGGHRRSARPGDQRAHHGCVAATLAAAAAQGRTHRYRAQRGGARSHRRCIPARTRGTSMSDNNIDISASAPSGCPV